MGRLEEAGKKIAESQGLDGQAKEMFIKALLEEYLSDALPASEANDFLCSLEDFKLIEVKKMKKNDEPVIKEVRTKTSGYYFFVVDVDPELVQFDHIIPGHVVKEETVESFIKGNEDWMDVVSTDELIYLKAETEKLYKMAGRKDCDKHIVGKVKSRNGKTIITSDEILPKELRNAEVEIRLKPVAKKKIKKEMVVDVTLSQYLLTLGEYVGKKMKVTIEEL